MVDSRVYSIPTGKSCKWAILCWHWIHRNPRFRWTAKSQWKRNTRKKYPCWIDFLTVSRRRRIRFPQTKAAKNISITYNSETTNLQEKTQKKSSITMREAQRQIFRQQISASPTLKTALQDWMRIRQVCKPVQIKRLYFLNMNICFCCMGLRLTQWTLNISLNRKR